MAVCILYIFGMAPISHQHVQSLEICKKLSLVTSVGLVGLKALKLRTVTW